MPMLGFEPRISGVGSDRSTNWATATDCSQTKSHKIWLDGVVALFFLIADDRNKKIKILSNEWNFSKRKKPRPEKSGSETILITELRILVQFWQLFHPYRLLRTLSLSLSLSHTEGTILMCSKVLETTYYDLYEIPGREI